MNFICLVSSIRPISPLLATDTGTSIKYGRPTFQHFCLKSLQSMSCVTKSPTLAPRRPSLKADMDYRAVSHAFYTELAGISLFALFVCWVIGIEFVHSTSIN